MPLLAALFFFASTTFALAFFPACNHRTCSHGYCTEGWVDGGKGICLRSGGEWCTSPSNCSRRR